MRLEGWSERGKWCRPPLQCGRGGKGKEGKVRSELSQAEPEVYQEFVALFKKHQG